MSDVPALSRNRRRGPERLRDPSDPNPEVLDGLTDGVIPLDPGNPAAGHFDAAEKTLSIPTEDGGVLIQFNAKDPLESDDDESDDDDAATRSRKFYRNLAEKIGDYERGRIVQEVLDGIEADDRSRQEWLETRAEGIKMLGTSLEKAQADTGSSAGPVEGMATVRHPLLLEAIVRFQSNAAAELYPTSGPVKVRDDRPVKPQGAMGANDIAQAFQKMGATPEQILAGLAAMGLGDAVGALGDNDNPLAPGDVAAADTASREEIAEALEKGFNHNLTVVDRGYRPDSVRMLFAVGFGGCAFKKIYDDPIKERPVARFVDAADIIVSNAVSDHRDAGRITHRIVLRPALVRRMQILGVYRDVQLHEPQFTPNPVEEATARAQGLDARPPRQEDQPRTLYESYVELDITGFEHKRAGKPTGIPLPYKVTIDKDAREILELRRNWEEGDTTFTARQVFVKYSFIPALGFYDLGLLHLLGNGERALTAAWRIALDSGMFGNFPGFIYNEAAIRNWTNQNRVPPGGGIGIKGIGNLPLDQVIKPLPYKDVSAAFLALIKGIEDRMDRVASTGELPVGEGRQDAPVGTTLALIEQATKVLAAVHIGLHDSQAQELQLLKERYKQNPEAFWRWNKKAPAWEREEFLRALDDFELTPAADPNTASHVIRLIKCQAVKTVAMMNPALYDMKAVDRWIFDQIGVADPDQFFAPPPDPNAAPPDPMALAKMAEVQAKLANIQAQGQQKQQALAAEGEQKRQQLAMEGQEGVLQHQGRMQEIQADAAGKVAERHQAAEEFALQSADRAADRQSEERREQMRVAGDLAKQGRDHAHDERTQIADQMHEADQTAAEHAHDESQQAGQQAHEARQQAAQPPKGAPGPGGGLALTPRQNPRPF